MIVRTLIAALAFTVLATGCRTTIAPAKRTPQDEVYIPPGGCNVRRYPESTDLPEGSKDLGWVEIELAETEDATYEAMDQRICGMGGDALSSLYWEKDSTETTAHRKSLRARAWVLP